MTTTTEEIAIITGNAFSTFPVICPHRFVKSTIAENTTKSFIPLKYNVSVILAC